MYITIQGTAQSLRHAFMNIDEYVIGVPEYDIKVFVYISKRNVRGM